MYHDPFTTRQTMLRESFEFYHFLDDAPPEVEYHQHPFYEVFFFLAGICDYTIEGRIYHLQPGDILLTSRQDLHRPEVRPGAPYERVVIWLSDSFFEGVRGYGDALSDCFRDAAGKNYRLIRPDQANFRTLLQICEQISAAQNSRQFGSNTLACAYLLTFLVHLNRCYYATPDTAYRDVTENGKINEILAYINEHLTENLTLDALSERFYLSSSFFSRQFRRFTGLSPYRYIMKKRLILAHDLLCEGAPATTAAMECGFGDYSNFLKAFKREFGDTPRAFAKAAD